MAKITIELNEAEEKLVDRFVRYGIYGVSRKDFVIRVLDEWLRKKLQDDSEAVTR